MPNTLGVREFHCRVETAISDLWRRLPPVDIGECPGEPSAFVLVTDGEAPFMRVNVHLPQAEYHLRTEAELWSGWIAVSFGARLVLVPLEGGDLHTIALSERLPPEFADYFCQITLCPDMLLICSGTAVLRVDPGGTVQWKSGPLGVDGVLIHSVNESTIEGEGEWDPPGGWLPFTISLTTGALISGGDPWA